MHRSNVNSESFCPVFFVVLHHRVNVQRSRHVLILIIIITPSANLSTECDGSALTAEEEQYKMSRLINIDLLHRRRLERWSPAEHGSNQSLGPEMALVASERMNVQQKHVQSRWRRINVLSEFQFRSVSTH